LLKFHGKSNIQYDLPIGSICYLSQVNTKYNCFESSGSIYSNQLIGYKVIDNSINSGMQLGLTYPNTEFK